MPKKGRYAHLKGSSAYYPFGARTKLRRRQRRHVVLLRVVGLALLVPADQTKTHLHTLSLVAKRLADKTICRRLRAAQSDEELYQIITDTEGTPDEA